MLIGHNGLYKVCRSPYYKLLSEALLLDSRVLDPCALYRECYCVKQTGTTASLTGGLGIAVLISLSISSYVSLLRCAALRLLL